MSALQGSVYTVDLSQDEIRIDLSPLDLVLKGDYVVGLQWAETKEGINNKISFPTSTFKKGFYYRDEGRWKKLPFFGIGMVVHGTTAD
ncbi:hypothetical protein [Olivibacter sitiensis]|uniref:hypothetical protein n=1 Tax=Olivibacter sitiensis TaxID=376470 RepID=UPI0012FA5B36|nr:hypothetical protein [Olivibacter sitiensis]